MAIGGVYISEYADHIARTSIDSYQNTVQSTLLCGFVVVASAMKQRKSIFIFFNNNFAVFNGVTI